MSVYLYTYVRAFEFHQRSWGLRDLIEHKGEREDEEKKKKRMKSVDVIRVHMRKRIFHEKGFIESKKNLRFLFAFSLLSLCKGLNVLQRTWRFFFCCSTCRSLIYEQRKYNKKIENYPWVLWKNGKIYSTSSMTRLFSSRLFFFILEHFSSLHFFYPSLCVVDYHFIFWS